MRQISHQRDLHKEDYGVVSELRELRFMHLMRGASTVSRCSLFSSVWTKYKLYEQVDSEDIGNRWHELPRTYWRPYVSEGCNRHHGTYVFSYMANYNTVAAWATVIRQAYSHVLGYLVMETAFSSVVPVPCIVSLPYCKYFVLLTYYMNEWIK